MKPDHSEDEIFLKLLSRSKLEFPFTGFEDSVMRKIELRQVKRSSVKMEIRLSLLFFVIGTIFGVVISFALARSGASLAGISLNKLAILFEALFSFLFIAQIKNFLDYYRQLRAGLK